MKKIEVEVEVDENLQLLEKHKDIVIRKNSNAVEIANKLEQRATDPSIAQNGNGDKKAENCKDVTYNGQPAGMYVFIESF